MVGSRRHSLLAQTSRLGTAGILLACLLVAPQMSVRLVKEAAESPVPERSEEITADAKLLTEAVHVRRTRQSVISESRHSTRRCPTHVADGSYFRRWSHFPAGAIGSAEHDQWNGCGTPLRI